MEREKREDEGGKGKGKGKGKKKKKCGAELTKIAGRCALVCDVDGLVQPEVCGGTPCSKTYVDATDGRPYVCVASLGDPPDCEALAAKHCLDHGDCGKNTLCVVSVICGTTYCAQLHVP